MEAGKRFTVNTLLPRKNYIVLVALLALLLILPIILYLTRRKQEIRPRALTGNVKFHLSPLSPNVTRDQEFDEVISVEVTNPNVKVSGADLVVLYDQTRLEVVSITPHAGGSNYFTDAPIAIHGQDFNNEFKSLRVSVVAKKTSSELEGGTKTIATVRFKGLTDGSATIKFSDDNSQLQVVGTGPTGTP